jgi:DNA-binding SARP family transcriptional activator
METGAPERLRLRQRLDAVRPSILALYAPAGYGKTAFLQEVYGDAGAVFCDCEGLRDDLDLARRLLPDLEHVLADGSRTVAERLDVAVEHFASLSPAVFIFDRARYIGLNPRAFEFFIRLLNRRPANATIVIAARKPLPLRLTRFAPPHEILVLRAADLAFDETEIRAMFAAYDLEGASLARIAAISQGWPVVVLLLRRLAGERRIHALLDRLADAAFVELHEYLTDEVLAIFDLPATQALFACAALPDAVDADIRDAFPNALSGDALAAFARETPFLHRDSEGVYSVHPMIAAVLLEHQEDRRRLVIEQLAMQREVEAQWIRAAEFHLASGANERAANALARYHVLADVRLPERFTRILVRLENANVQRYPHLWGMSAMLRLFREPPEMLLDEAEAIWRTVPPSALLRERYPVFMLRMLLMAALGRLQQAHAEVDEWMHAAEGTKFQPYFHALRAYLRARSGALDAAQTDLEAAITLAGKVMSTFLYLTLGAEISRARGDRMELPFLERALAEAKASGIESVQALLVAELLIANWLAGDEARTLDAARELERYVDRGCRGFTYLATAVLGGEGAPGPADLPEFAIYGALIELSHTRDDRRRIRLAQSAYTRASDLSLPFLEVLTALAVAYTDEAQFDEYAKRAVAHASLVESKELQASVASIVANDANGGMLGAFAAGLTRGDSEMNPPLEVSLASASVRINGVAVDLAGRELELLLALALRREATSRARLAALLWPDLDEASARNAFSVCLHRLRARLTRKDAIERDGEGYRLHAHAVVDLWELERVLAVQPKKGALGERDRLRLERLWGQLRKDSPIPTEGWEWFDDVARRLRESRVAIAHRLGDDALARGDVNAAIAYADAALAEDRCDERAAEIGIRAYLSSGDRASAMRRYRQYRAALHAELGAEPSFSLTALVTTS